MKLLGITNVGIHNLSPGMVTTELLMAGKELPARTCKKQHMFLSCR